MLMTRVAVIFLVLMACGMAMPLAHAGCKTTATMHTCTDIAYGNAPYQTLDIYRPPAAGLYPTLIYVHGGGWNEGDKSLAGVDHTGVLRQVVKGYAVVSINYRLVDGTAATRAPGALLDVKRAVRWVKAVGATMGLDRERVMLWGHSAGGHLATLAAATSGDAGTEPEGFAQVDSSVKFVFSFAGVYDFAQTGGPLPRALLHSVAAYLGCSPPNFNDPQLVKCTAAQLAQWSPARVISADDPRVLLVHNRSDIAVPYSQARVYGEQLASFGKPVVACDPKVAGIASHVSFSACDAQVDLVLALLMPPGARQP